MAYFTPELTNDISFALAFTAAVVFFLLAIIMNRKLYREKASHSQDSAEVLKQRKWLTLFYSAFAIVLIFSPRIASLKISTDGVGFTTNAQSLVDTASDTAAKWAQEKKENQLLQDELAKAKWTIETYQAGFVRQAKSASEHQNNLGFDLPVPTEPEPVIAAAKSYEVTFSNIEIIKQCEFLNDASAFFWDLKLNDKISSEKTIEDAVRAGKQSIITLSEKTETVTGKTNDYFVISGAVFERDSRKFTTLGVLSEVVSFKEVAQALEQRNNYDKAIKLRKDRHCEVIVHVNITEKKAS